MSNRNERLKAGRVATWLLTLPSGKLEFDGIKAEQLGYDSTEERFQTYKGFTDLIHPDDYENTMQAMRDHMSGKVGRYFATYRILASDGKYHTYMDQGTIVEKTEDSMCIMGATVDVT